MQKTDKIEENTSANEETGKNHDESTNVTCEDTQEKQKEIIEKETTPKKQENENAENERTPNKIETVTPKKQSTPKDEKNEIIQNNNSTPLKELKEIESKFKTPEKTVQHNQSYEKTPEKFTKNDLKLDPIVSCDGEDGMISTTEQARLLIAASRTPSKSMNKTPVKHSTPSGKRSLENSPVTPGKHRRVELITLASPKAKRIKQM